jgi:DNA-directed RNA polymerase delta subunit
MRLNLKKICSQLVSVLPPKQKEVIIRRFGLFGREKETLESIGRDFGVCRERIRQIEEWALDKIRGKAREKKEIFDQIFSELKKRGGVVKEETLLKEKGNEILLLLKLDRRFQRQNQTNEFFAFWTIGKDYVSKAKKFISNLIKRFKKEKKLLNFVEISKIFKIEKPVLSSFLEISKLIGKDKEDFYGLKDWPEINPKGIRDKAYLLLRKIQKPLHFSEIAKQIEGAKVATVHNELIKDKRFVLVGRGTYALTEWGYWPGEVKEIILKILQKNRRPMTKEEILAEVRKQRLVKPTTVFLYLYNKNYFEKDENGKYRPKTQKA